MYVRSYVEMFEEWLNYGPGLPNIDTDYILRTINKDKNEQFYARLYFLVLPWAALNS